VNRVLRFYFAFLASAGVLFVLAAWLTAAQQHVFGWMIGLGRFVILMGGAASAFGAWATAVTIAYVHRVRWPFLLMTSLIASAGLTFAAINL